MFNFLSGVIGKNLHEKRVELRELEDCESQRLRNRSV